MSKDFIKMIVVIKERNQEGVVKMERSIQHTLVCSVIDNTNIHDVTISKQVILDYFNKCCGDPGREFAKFRELANYYGFYTRIVIVLGNGITHERWFTFSEFLQLSAMDMIKHFKSMLEE